MITNRFLTIYTMQSNWTRGNLMCTPNFGQFINARFCDNHVTTSRIIENINAYSLDSNRLESKYRIIIYIGMLRIIRATITYFISFGKASNSNIFCKISKFVVDRNNISFILFKKLFIVFFVTVKIAHKNMFLAFFLNIVLSIFLAAPIGAVARMIRTESDTRFQTLITPTFLKKKFVSFTCCHSNKLFTSNIFYVGFPSRIHT